MSHSESGGLKLQPWQNRRFPVAYGIVAVFEDLYGNRWDLVEFGCAQ